LYLKDGLVRKQNSLVEAPVLLYPLNDITLSCISDKAKLTSEAYKGVDEYIHSFCTFGQVEYRGQLNTAFLLGK
jgi:hypothetical protein